jgi:hypothetical protein
VSRKRGIFKVTFKGRTVRDLPVIWVSLRQPVFTNSGGNSAGEDHIDLEPILDVLDHDAGDLYGIANILLGAAPVVRPGKKLGGFVDVNP